MAFPLTVGGSTGVYHMGVFSMDNLGGIKVFALKCLFLNFNYIPGPIFYLLVEIIVG